MYDGIPAFYCPSTLTFVSNEWLQLQKYRHIYAAKSVKQWLCNGDYMTVGSLLRYRRKTSYESDTLTGYV